MTPHIEAKKEDIAKIVLMPGDPMRAKMIAEKYLEDYKLVNEVRGILAYTGYYKGQRVTVMASGMGMPSMGIYSYELYTSYDVECIIRIGSAGAYVKELALYDLILVSEAYSESTFAKVQNGSIDNFIKADLELNQIISDTASVNSTKLHTSKIECSDVFYKENNDYKYLVDMGCNACEMESFALFHNARILNKKAACLLTVSNNWETMEETTSEERQNAFTGMVELALESSVKIGEKYGF